MSKKIETLVNGQWVEWDGVSDTTSYVVTEEITLSQFKKYFPEAYKVYIKQNNGKKPTWVKYAHK